MPWDPYTGEWVNEEPDYLPPFDISTQAAYGTSSGNVVPYAPGQAPGQTATPNDPSAGFQPDFYGDFVQGLGDRYGVTPDPGDVATLAGKATGDVYPHMQSLEEQYRARAVSPGGTSTPTPRPRTTSVGLNQLFSYPDWTPPDIQFGSWVAPSWDVTPFTYPEFVGPTSENFQADPGYDFRAGEMDRAIKNMRSAQGLLSTGGTLAELMRMRGALASQEFGNVWNRQFQGWDANRRNALDQWQSGYQLESDEFARDLQSYLTQEAAKENEWNRSRDAYSLNLAKEMGSYGLSLDADRLGLARENSSFGNLLSLATLALQGRPSWTPTV